MNAPMETLLCAKKALAGKYSEDSVTSITSAVEYILDYLLAKEAAEEYKFICEKIDDAQRRGDTVGAAKLMKERDEVLQCMK